MADADVLMRVSSIEATQSAMLEEQRRTGQKLDTLLDLSIKIASAQGDIKNLNENISRLSELDSDKEKRLKIVESRIHWGKGVVAVIFAVIIPSTGWILSNAYSQISAIDRRLLGVEYQMQKPVQMGH